MKLVVDMNLSPTWVGFLASQKIEAVHWSQVGDPRATDATIMNWAREHGYAVFTHDLDFGAILTETTSQQVFVVTNTGDATVSNGTATVTGGPYSIVSGSAFTLTGGGSTNVAVQFAPESAG